MENIEDELHDIPGTEDIEDELPDPSEDMDASGPIGDEEAEGDLGSGMRLETLSDPGMGQPTQPQWQHPYGQQPYGAPPPAPIVVNQQPRLFAVEPPPGAPSSSMVAMDGPSNVDLGSSAIAAADGCGDAEGGANPARPDSMARPWRPYCEPGVDEPSAPEEERLKELDDLIAKRTRWTPQEQEHGIALLLMYKDYPQLARVPRRPEADKYLASGPCVFFVDKGMPADGKKRKSESTSEAGGSSKDEKWIKGTSTSATGGSLDKNVPSNARFSAVLRKSGGFTPDDKKQYGPRSIGHYCLGYIEGKPGFVEDHIEDRTRTLRVGRNKEMFQPCTPVTWLVHCMPTERERDDAESPGAPDQPDTTSGSPMATGSVGPHVLSGDLRVKGSATIESDLTVWGTLRHDGGALVSGRADHAEYLRKYDEEEELNGGDVVALVGDDDGMQKASHRARGSTTAVWMVVTTEPQMLGNAPEPGQERLWVPLVFSGQVSVPPRTSYLSGY